MSNLKVSLADEIAKKCIEGYNKLPKKGKPVGNEWTVLSCVVQSDQITGEFEVVSLGTGSKCVGASKMSSKGDVLNDSHAEVMARRAFLVYLYDNIRKSTVGETTIFIFENSKYKLKENIKFYFYSSQLPCGDACIIPKSVENDLVGDILNATPQQSNKRSLAGTEDVNSETGVKKQKLDSDIHRTGAKCLPHCDQDAKDPGFNYHLLGQVRTKPGRGDRTLSVSCSDKISRWIHLGINGGLLDMLLDKPIFMQLYVFGGGVPYSEESIERAFLRRNTDSSEVTLECIPEFLQSTIVFSHIKSGNNRAAPGSIVWVKLENMCPEVAIQGRKLGVTKKNVASISNLLCISKYNLYRRFLEILLNNEVLKNSISEEAIEGIPYNAMKLKSKRYIEKWSFIKTHFFGSWTVKPDIFNFCVEFI